MVEPEEAQAARDAIAGTIADIDAKELKATKRQREYLAGAVAAIDGLVQAEPGTAQTSDS